MITKIKNEMVEIEKIEETGTKKTRSAYAFIAVCCRTRNKSQTHRAPHSGAALPLLTSKRSHVYRGDVSPQCATPTGSNGAVRYVFRALSRTAINMRPRWGQTELTNKIGEVGFPGLHGFPNFKCN